MPGTEGWAEPTGRVWGRSNTWAQTQALWEHCINQATSGKTAFRSFRVRCGLAAASVCPHEGERISKKDSKQLRGRTLKIHKWVKGYLETVEKKTEQEKEF